MTRIKYIRVGNYLVSKNNFSTKVHEELQYVTINLDSFCFFLVNASVPRDPTRLNYHVPEFAHVAGSLIQAKKDSKQLLIDSGVTFNVEARNRNSKTEEANPKELDHNPVV